MSLYMGNGTFLDGVEHGHHNKFSITILFYIAYWKLAFSWISCIVRLTSTNFNRVVWGGGWTQSMKNSSIGLLPSNWHQQTRCSWGLFRGRREKDSLATRSLMEMYLQAHKSLRLEFLAIFLILEIFPTVAVFKYSLESTILLRCD